MSRGADEPRSGELSDVRVLDATTGISGAYCAKLLGDAGAEVVLVEPPSGARLRYWTCGGANSDPRGGALFDFLRGGHRSITEVADDLLASVDVVLVEADGPLGRPAELHARFPGLVVVAITPWGLDGPWSGRPWSDLVMQAENGSLGARGRLDGPPVQMGGHVTEWVAGVYAAVATLAARRAVRGGAAGELVDLSILEVGNVTSTLFGDLMYALRGSPDLTGAPPARTFETPSIEPTLDGYVGFNTNTRLQFEAFALLIERPDLLDDPSWFTLVARNTRWHEWNEIVHAWTARHTTAEIVERAADLRIPVAPVGDAASILALDLVVERGIFVDDATGRFRMPRRPWSINDEPAPAPRPAPAIGADDGRLNAKHPLAPGHGGAESDGERAADHSGLPLTGVRVLDLTAWWAGPSSTAMLAALGADVIHVESTGHPDGMRMAGASIGMDGAWWEKSAIFLQANANKRGITLDLTSERGRELLLRLVPHCDLVVENFTPRVFEQFGLTWDVIHAANPRAVMVRMPAFGLDGPWRDRPGFAQTMEQLTGLAWVTGMPGDQPRIQRGPCDPNAGMHSAFAMLLALQRRDRTGVGCLVEVPMVEAAFNVAAEVTIEWTAYGRRLERIGNRSHRCAPQGVYRCTGVDRWLAISIATDDQWSAFSKIVGIPGGVDSRFADHAGRWAHHDELDGLLAAWAADRDAGETADMLIAAGIPAAEMRDPRLSGGHPQFTARGFVETVEHPTAGPLPIAGVPFRFGSVDRWLRSPAPLIGQHNDEVLGGILGCSAEDLAALAEAGVIGNRPKGY